MHAAGDVSKWRLKGVENFYRLHAKNHIAATHRLKREFDTIRMSEGEDALLFLGSVDKATDQLEGYARMQQERRRGKPAYIMSTVNNVSTFIHDTK